jgi:hypothetical protein|tara:strand:- start:415 stop:720 length:306 start_codon:yes stop_codon:yes gene_type:complete
VITKRHRDIDRIIINKANQVLPPLQYIRVIKISLNDGSKRVIYPKDFNCKSTVEFFEREEVRQFQSNTKEVEVILDMKKFKNDLQSTNTTIWQDEEKTTTD